MNPKNTWFWLAIAAVLFLAILLHHRFARPPGTGPVKVLPGLNAAAVTSVQVQPQGQLLIRAERTNHTWRLTQPVPYPAQAASIQSLLAALERLTPAAFITAHERQNRPKVDEAEGLLSPQAAIAIGQGDYSVQLDVGARTAPGDQVYLQVVGVAGVYVVDADLLKEIPRTKDDWRDTALLGFDGLVFDRLAVTNAGKALELQYEAGNHLWRIVNPAIGARADAGRISDLLQQLQNLRVTQFVSDEPKADLEAFGLEPPELELALARGTNTVALLQFGKSPTNDPALVYARLLGRNTVVTVSTNALGGWRDPFNAFRPPNVIDLPESVAAIEVHGPDSFSLQLQATNGWRLLPLNLPADAGAVKDLLASLGHLSILEPFDLVTAPQLARYGLAAPARKYILKTGPASPGATNPALAEVDIGATNQNKVFVRRADETSVYAVNLADLERLPAAGFQMRARQIWNFSDDDIARVIIRQPGKVRQLIHTDKGRQAWSLAPGSDGAIEPMAVGETVRQLAQLTATNWVAHGLPSPARCGFAENGRQITLELKNDGKLTVELGGPTPAGSLYGAVPLEGEPWVFEFPIWLAQWITSFLLPSPP
ncbi:MAG: DUF4340 domain-containing protein [Verrucomicrobiota bacterium]|jgi:hypothetical protein